MSPDVRPFGYPIPVVVGLCVDRWFAPPFTQQYLLTQRALDLDFPGIWHWPGGKIEPGESAQQALQRELHQELGQWFTIADVPFGTFSHSVSTPDDGLSHWLLIGYQCTPDSAEPQFKSNKREVLGWNFCPHHMITDLAAEGAAVPGTVELLLQWLRSQQR